MNVTDDISAKTESKIDRKYKSHIFEMIFSDKKELLSLYNAANNSNYDDPELLEINTLKNAIYMGIHNDISFVIDSRLGLYEHQSTVNPNMPLRCLMYISDLYSGMTKDENLYGRRLIKLATPHFLVFYNGEDEQPERVEMKLSDAFCIKEEQPSLELKVIMLNINVGYNKDLMGACKTLADYAEYTDRVRRYAKVMSIENAVERAVDECIQEGILAEFLSKNRSEAIKVSIYEYDQQKHIRQEREDAYAEGQKDGYNIGQKAGYDIGQKEGCRVQLMKSVKVLKAKGMNITEIAELLAEEVEVIRDIFEA